MIGRSHSCSVGVQSGRAKALKPAILASVLGLLLPTPDAREFLRTCISCKFESAVRHDLTARWCRRVSCWVVPADLVAIAFCEIREFFLLRLRRRLSG